jgi:hypothetical protein
MPWRGFGGFGNANLLACCSLLSDAAALPATTMCRGVRFAGRLTGGKQSYIPLVRRHFDDERLVSARFLQPLWCPYDICNHKQNGKRCLILDQDARSCQGIFGAGFSHRTRMSRCKRTAVLMWSYLTDLGSLDSSSRFTYRRFDRPTLGPDCELAYGSITTKRSVSRCFVSCLDEKTGENTWQSRLVLGGCLYGTVIAGYRSKRRPGWVAGSHKSGASGIGVH